MKSNNRNTMKRLKNPSKSTIASSNGMTLVEVVVALGLLVVVMFFISSSQLSAIKLYHKTGIIRELTHTAEREMENRRQIPEDTTTITSSLPVECLNPVEDYACQTTVHPCSIVDHNIVCVDTFESSFPEEKAIAHQIVVDVVGPEDRTILLQTIVGAVGAE